MYKIVLNRLKEYKDVKKPNKDKIENSTIGKLTVYNENCTEVLFSCYTVENGGPSTDIVNSDTRILPRVYKLEWTTSSVALPKDWKPKCITTVCPTDPKHKARRIHIHVGNYPQDTEGCILLNKTDNTNGTCSTSGIIVSEFYKLVEKLGIENFELEIKEIEE